jgi:hypothetical protein
LGYANQQVGFREMLEDSIGVNLRFCE